MYFVQKMRIHAPFMGYPGYYHPGSSWTLEDDGDLEGRMRVYFLNMTALFGQSLKFSHIKLAMFIVQISLKKNKNPVILVI